MYRATSTRRGNLQVQEANFKSQKDADRYHELDKHDAIAKQQVDYADAALEVSKKQVAAAKANVASVQSNVKFASYICPFNRDYWYFPGQAGNRSSGRANCSKYGFNR